jgi:MOSC domain-containing protein YiiM
MAALLSDDPHDQAWAGDQLYVDLDLSVENLPAGTRLAIGDAVVEITAPPHTGCAIFVRHFGEEAMRFVNSRTGRAMRLRGANGRVVTGGAVRTGDKVTVHRVPALW